MAQVSADAAVRIELEQLRAELSLLRTQVGKQAQTPDVSAPRVRSTEPSHREADVSADTIEAETTKQDAEEAAKFYKEQWRMLKIQVDEQNKAIADLRVLLQRPQRYNLSPSFEEVREAASNRV